MVSILKMHRPFPTFAEALTHLLLEELEIDALPPSPPAALVAETPRPVAPAHPRHHVLGAPSPPAPYYAYWRPTQRSSSWTWWPLDKHQQRLLCTRWTQQLFTGRATVVRPSLGWHRAHVAVRPVRIPDTATCIPRRATQWSFWRPSQRLQWRLRRTTPLVRCVLRGSCTTSVPGTHAGISNNALEPHSRWVMEPGLPDTLLQHHDTDSSGINL
jgi:hypothetical protein